MLLKLLRSKLKSKRANWQQLALFVCGNWLLILSHAVIAMPPANQQEALSVHNKLRKLHASPPLQWDDELASFATKYASHCELKHSHHAGYGENLAAGYPTVTAAIQAWYAENKLYSYEKAQYTPGLGHFTQLIWKSTTKIGCGYAVCDGKNGVPGTFLVCEYSPAGNVVNEGYFRENVHPAG